MIASSGGRLVAISRPARCHPQRERERDPEIGGREAERGGRDLENLRRRQSSEWERGRDGKKGGLFPLAAYLKRERERDCGAHMLLKSHGSRENSLGIDLTQRLR